MNFYTTPNKQSADNVNKTLSTNKNCDWVCIVCNNLNFSFRKKCNRCKKQTRVQNQNHIASAYSQYYYTQKYSESSQQKSPLSDATNLYTPFKIGNIDPYEKLNRQEKCSDIHLSNLAKKYCPKTTHQNQQFSSTKKQIYYNDFWQYINIVDFEENSQTKHKEQPPFQQDFDDQLESLINKILIDE